MRKKASKEKQQGWNRSRSDLLGVDHKQTRNILRAELAPGKKSCSGKRRIKVLHRLGHCCMLLGVDYMTYEYVGASFPDADSYDMVGTSCAMSKDLESDPNSSCTNTSSTSEDEK